MIKKFRLLLFFFFLILLTVGNYANAEIRANSQTQILSTFIGEGAAPSGPRMAIDKDGYIYVAVWSYIIKLNPDMTAVEYSYSFNRVGIRGVAIDDNGKVYIVGGAGPGIPVTPDALFPNCSGIGDGFITILNPDGTIDYCSYFGGEDLDYARSVAVDKDGYVYVCGYTESLYFPVFNALYPNKNGGPDAFVIKFNPGARTICYSTYLGGSDMDVAYEIATDQNGNVYVTGESSWGFPTTPDAFGSGGSTFVTKINAFGTALVYSACWGGALTTGFAIAADRDGNAYVTGFTNVGRLATPDAYDTIKDGLFDTFVAKINSDGSKLVWFTYLGGDDDDVARAIAIDTVGNVYVVGDTDCSDFPVTSGAYQTSIKGDRSHWSLFTTDIFLSKFSPDGKKLLYSTYFGGSQNDIGLGIAVNELGDVYITGYTKSPDFPVSSGVYDETYNGSTDGFVTKFFLSRLTSLIISANPGGTTNPEPKKEAYNYTKGAQAKIEAIPDSGYEFNGWTGDVPQGHEKDNPITIVMDSDKSITANFKALPLPDKPNKPKGCFIATAVYGSPLHPYVKILRNFRDKYLMTNKAGRTLVNLYYKYSPSIADFIAKHKSLKTAVQIMLLPLIIFSYSILYVL